MPWKQSEETGMWQKERVIQELRSQGKRCLLYTSPYEQTLVRDLIRARIPKKLEREKLFAD